MIDDILVRYQQAQTMMQGMLSTRLVLNDAVFPHWITHSHSGEDSGCFWYIRETREGEESSAGRGPSADKEPSAAKKYRLVDAKEYRLVDANTATNTLAFDHQMLAELLASATGETIDPANLPLGNLTINSSPLQIRFQALDKHWLYQPETENMDAVEAPPVSEGILSPDGSKTVFVRDFNLWVRDQQTHKEQALTQDGTADNGYASAPISATVQLLWSPNSKTIFTHQLDLRQVAKRTVTQHVPFDGSVRPQSTEMAMAYPGDEQVESYRLLAINTESGEVQAADYRPLSFYGMGEGFFSDEKLGWWAKDSRRAFFVDVSRGAKTIRVVEFDTHMGTTRTLFEETSDTFVRLSHSIMESPVIFPLPDSDELIWFSERSGCAQLYLYDLKTGKLKHALTEGKDLAADSSQHSNNKGWLVRNILQVDTQRREIVLQTAGRHSDISPYYRDICRVDIDSGKLTPLVSGDYEYLVYGPRDRPVGVRAAMGLDSGGVSGISPSGQYIVSTRSRVDTAPVSLLIDRHGETILELETADVSALPVDWQWPEPVKVLGADGQTDIYGVVYRPPGFSPDKQYPVLDFSCGHPSFTFVPQGSFINGPVIDAPYLFAAAYAALGFVVIALEGRGTPYRDKAFQDYSYGCIASASAFDDRIAGIRQLAKQYPYIDSSRVGLFADDGNAGPVHGLLQHPDFYSVAIAICLDDARLGMAALCERFEGVSTDNQQETKIQNGHAEGLVPSLSGKLLLIHGVVDPVMPLAGMLRITNALQLANKDFDMLLLPRNGHDIPTYALRRSWDYLVTHLQGIEPPKEFELKTSFDLLAG